MPTKHQARGESKTWSLTSPREGELLKTGEGRGVGGGSVLKAQPRAQGGAGGFGESRPWSLRALACLLFRLLSF